MDKAIELKNKGNDAFKNKQFKESIEFYSEAIQLSPNDQALYSNRSGAYINLEDYNNAYNDAQKCVEIKSDWSKGYQRKGLAEYHLEKYDEAVVTYNKGLELDPNNQQLKDGLNDVQKGIELRDLASKGFENTGQKPNNQFITGLISKLQQNAKTREYLKDKSFMDKLQMISSNPMMFSSLMQQDPRIQEAFNVMLGGMGGMNMAGMGGEEGEGGDENPQFEMPKQPKQQQKQQGGQSSQPQQQQQYQQQQQQQKPKEEQKKEANLDAADKFKNEGNEFYKNKQFDKALEKYEEAIKLKPQELLYYNNKAAVYIEMGQLDKAKAEIEQALKIKEEHMIFDFVKLAKVYARYGSIYEKEDNVEKAIEWYHKSLLEDKNEKLGEDVRRLERVKKQRDSQAYINPEKANEHNEKGKELFHQGSYAQAMKEYEEAIRRDPLVAKYYFNRGLCYIKLMGYQPALQDFDKCLEIEPNHIKAIIKKAVCETQINQLHRALATYERALKIEPDNQDAKQGLQQVQYKIQVNFSSHDKDEEKGANNNMNDPEIQQILRTPEVQNALKAMQNDPKETQKILSDPFLGPKFQKLIAAGILKMK